MKPIKKWRLRQPKNDPIFVHLDPSSTSQWHSMRGSARNFSGSDAPQVAVSAVGCRMSSLASNLRLVPESRNVHSELWAAAEKMLGIISCIYICSICIGVYIYMYL